MYCLLYLHTNAWGKLNFYLQYTQCASHQCYMRMTCNTPTPGHPSAADDPWYWQKCVLCIGWLSFLTSRPMWYMTVCSQGSCGSLSKSCTWKLFSFEQQNISLIVKHNSMEIGWPLTLTRECRIRSLYMEFYDVSALGTSKVIHYII